MSDRRYQYRITVNGAQGPITEHYDAAQWSKVVGVMEERGGFAKLENRLIVDGNAAGFLACLCNPRGYIVLGDTVVCPWEVLAEAMVTASGPGCWKEN